MTVPSRKQLDISVLISTYNRADILRQTLDNVTGINCEGISIEYIVIDNNSSDHTKTVVDSFKDRLSIVYLFESNPGKNCALNKALNEIELGELVVFTDDDVRPNPDWLSAIIEVSKRRTEFDIFGGKIYPIWPEQDVPDWIRTDAEIRILCYSEHDYGNEEVDYKHIPQRPFGPNFWVRKSIFDDGRRFNEHIGPRPKDRIMGSETSFLLELNRDGYNMFYAPQAIVGHYIVPHQISEPYLLRRAYTKGKSIAFLGEPKPQRLYKTAPPLWYLGRVCSWIKYFFIYITTRLYRNKKKRVLRGMHAMKWMGYNAFYLKNGADPKRKSIGGKSS